MVKTTDIILGIIAKDLKKSPSDALVIGVAQGADGPVLLSNPLSAKAAESLAGSLKILGITGATDQAHRLPGLPETGSGILVLAGVGKLNDDGSLGEEALRRAAGSAVRQLAGTASVTLAFPTTTPADVTAVAEGAALGAYSYTEHRSSKDGLNAPVAKVLIFSDVDAKSAQPGLDRAIVLARAVNSTRTLVNQPPSHLYPESFAESAKELAKGLPVKITVWDEKRLEKEGFGGILGVGKGSTRQPRLVKVEYAPAKATKKIALVGKGITFDTGGISIKPALGMGDMKSDMAGAAVVLNTVLAIASLGLPLKATAWLCIAENMPSGAAARPADVFTIYGGKTVEVLNTDAEGRLVMADGIVAASLEKPDAIIDVATLTGAQLIALGLRTAGVMGSDSVTQALKSAADRAGELVWPMPLPEELRPSLDSQVADLANIGERNGGMMTAAVFLREFVGKNDDGQQIPWAHVDIAGPSFNNGAPYGYTPKQGTGCTVRTLLAYAEDLLDHSA
ncbi:leucyl aminopeptidase [Paenarthrobacter aurescens]|uniref:Probable cytosol aminopeptidase n=1 Tax=Paenarthrobacter aurescens TaxID=43663 RepID=A0A4Y3NH84_PAEAU|nr:leucyl aminopeptidase [Paenarthrobacter aurescens]MDO6143266.1 leucyl aminopeptidase [Paenarthrobacter aurescens]MDO6147114.1 leucyl aminopeptidase [Paenarthrobacter aurescens]MDO6158358.1 leucyl aminopeptidase [Paenarthrobacter aurescens]MDO6162342.1 leucyl aminopeptidase [Paenarthrobacter aurescens]GEB18079.1 putative cytosol aminopeptidase [Paenarthrobacter aurescens]